MSLTFEPIAVPLRVDETGTVRLAGSRVTLRSWSRARVLGSIVVTA
jgi:hypothetical protein